jgi:hypothetical protein
MDFKGKGGKEGSDHSTEAGYNLPMNIVNRRTAGILGWVIGYFIAIWLFGFSIGLPLCAFVHLKIGAREKWLITFILIGSIWGLIYCLFDLVMHVPFPTGKLWLLLNLG